MQQTVEIYRLADPETGEVRYIGKAVCAQKRLKSHVRDARRRHTPVCCWIAKLVAAGSCPVIASVEVVPLADWAAHERVAIAAARVQGMRLLNLADGGDEPFCSKEIRAANARKVAKSRTDTPEKARIYEAKRRIGQYLRAGLVKEAGKAKLRLAARNAPHLFGVWANLE